MADLPEKKRHFILEGVTDTEEFRGTGYGEKAVIPERNRGEHGGALLEQVEALRLELDAARTVQEEAGLEGGFGLQVEFESFPDIHLAFESLARERSGIELLNVRHEGDRTYATIFVPDGKLEHFERMIQDYLAEHRDKAGRVRDHKALINAIERIRAATLRALWTDDPAVYPAQTDEVFWWEVWLPIREDRAATVENFRRLAELRGMVAAPGNLEFPERTVLLVRTSAAAMSESIMTLNSIAELRRGKETAEFFDALPPEEQAQWLTELLERCQFPNPDDRVPCVCVLDTGVNRGHPLIEPALAESDSYTIDPNWGTGDSHGHGTQMAGLALAGNLTEVLDSSEAINIGHRLESVKLLATDGANAGDSRHHGYLTTEAIARPEVTDPHRSRVFSMAITAKDGRDRGRPSAWSSALDSIAVDAVGDGTSRRLIVVSAGNADPNAWVDYPSSNTTDGIHDPAQSWNALTVGAYTNLVEITEPDTAAFEAIAPEGGLSPFSTTSATWQTHWPLKPDVLFEGGNAAKDSLSAVWMPSLSLVTTNHRPDARLFTTTNATSAATALAARMAAQLMAAYPELWPESIRCLIVHSAEWTDAMLKMFLPTGRQPTKSDYARLVRHCGFGVPDLDRALWSLNNSLSMVIQSALHPFKRVKGKAPTLRDMNLHWLPWPLPELEALGETPVEMRVTLSYFIEPNPSQRGFRSRYRYESHGLRFDVKRPSESDDGFRARINAAARSEEEGTSKGGSDPSWVVGTNNRHRGSVHSDMWRGSAADLASRGVLAVYPALGWWKTRPGLERYDAEARYSLIVSIRAPGVDVDLYTPIANLIAQEVEVES
jgi:hypothetical protein